ncbi:MAG: TonB-dependent receptor [Bacteroidetes bacterium HGW-Bacteroidetes-1]|nr:MAG: TonB-dependent receptor [Bacteroidetes bacterium HGW-Bacteroidetes-1]
MIKPIPLIILMLFSVSLMGQTRQISGTVTDAKGVPLPGVTVQIVGTTIGTTTDLDGMYFISADNESIKFSYVGFEEQIIPVLKLSRIDVLLVEDVKTLNEVVVIGYGTQKKKDLTTSVAVVDEKAMKDRPLISAAEGLQGKAAGVQVVQPSGKPGSGLSVRVRGATSVLAGNEPLYVVDGFPTTDIRSINPSDISSMSVLKDASSAAIYGARAANGVVIITTKRGSDNETSIKYNAYYGMSDLRKNIEVLNTKRYRDLMDEILPGSLDPSQTAFNNWPDKVFGTGNTQSHQLSYAGGTDKASHFVSLSYLTDQGIVEPARFDRYSVRINLDNEIKPWLNITTNLNMMHLNTKDTPDNASSGRGGVIMSALNTPPFLSVYKKDGSGQYDPNPFQPSWENPIAYMEGPDQQSIDNQISGSINAELSLMKDLKLNSRVGLDLLTHQWDYYLDPFRTNYGRNNNGIGQSDKTTHSTILWENTLNYIKNFGNHHISALAGNSIQKYKGNNSYIYGTDFPEDVEVTTLNAANIIDASTSVNEWALASFFGRATYDYNSKYYLTMSVRRDGSSKLAQHWGTMPSFSAGWRISSESFMKDFTFINDLKLRGGWGKNGNQEGIPNYARYGLVSYYRRTPTNPLSGPASVQVTYGNPDLRWETTAQTNIGFDLSMLNYRVTVNVDAYIKKTEDVLLNVQLSSSLPISTIQTNAGTIENKGIEFNINTINMDKKLKWTSDFNMSFNKNKVISLEYTDVYYFGRIYSNNQDVSILKADLPLGSFFGYISDGVDPETGNIKYNDFNNNGIFDTGDRTIIGDPNPDFIFGFTNNLTYKRFDLNLFFQGSYGNDIYNATRIDLEGMFDSKNQSVDVLRRWKSPGDITDIPKAGNINNVRNSSRFIEDGSYIRLKSISLSYKVLDNNPRFKAIKNLSVYITGRNLITLTNYSGFDPEVNAYGSSATELGVDYGTYPQSRAIVVGLNVEF